jgi:nitroimidazol reductase NimA-like FMN-containing flavoprotein (pyridoxamine 5'-phosphate oxidase superfamily)
MEDTMGEPIELSDAQCRELLSAGVVGRVALCTPVGPHIVPVNYTIVDDSVVVRTTPYSVLGAQARGALLAFEVDQLDYQSQRGWSVVAVGRAEAITAADELHQIRRAWEPDAWAAGTRNLFLRLRWSQITGRRLGSDWNPLDDLPARRAV